jgi:ABC-2 type transport system permease protein
VLVLLAKDVRVLVRSPLLVAALLAYPLVIALLVGLVVRYAGERPTVALVDEAGALPSVLVVGDESFRLQERLEQAAEVKLVRTSAAEAERRLRSGEVLASVVVPEGFGKDLRSLKRSPSLVVRTTQGGLSTRVVEKMRSLVYRTNLDLQKAYIDANLGAVDLLLRGGTGTIGRTELTLLGLDRAERGLRALVSSPDPAVRARAKELRRFVLQLRGAVGQVELFLRATANPIRLVTAQAGGRGWVLSAQAQAYTLALALAFAAILLGAQAVTAEREEDVLGRLLRGPVSPGELVAEKVVLVSLAAAVLGLVLAVAFGAVVELGDVAGGEPWERLPLLAAGLVLAGAAFGAFGVLLGTVARTAGTATLVAFLVALPVTLAGLVPRGSVRGSWVADAFPFGHAVRLLGAVLYDARPLGAAAREAAWLAGLALVMAVGARLGVRRLLR